jgi:hypothetical protein
MIVWSPLEFFVKSLDRTAGDFPAVSSAYASTASPMNLVDPNGLYSFQLPVR